MSEAVCNRCGRTFNAWVLNLRGTPQDGGATCQKCRSTATRGEKRPAAKLTEYDVIRMREERASGSTVKSLASKYGVSESCIYYVTNRRSWKHVA